jgi:hypothetical protein
MALLPPLMAFESGNPDFLVEASAPAAISRSTKFDEAAPRAVIYILCLSEARDNLKTSRGSGQKAASAEESLILRGSIPSVFKRQAGLF